MNHQNWTITIKPTRASRGNNKIRYEYKWHSFLLLWRQQFCFVLTGCFSRRSIIYQPLKSFLKHNNTFLALEHPTTTTKKFIFLRNKEKEKNQMKNILNKKWIKKRIKQKSRIEKNWKWKSSFVSQILRNCNFEASLWMTFCLLRNFLI